MIEEVLKKITINGKKKILDLGTGSGAIALSIASERNNAVVLGIDNNILALSVAIENSKLLNINNVFFLYSNWFSNITKNTFDIIVSNPPYLSFSDFYCSNTNIIFEPISSLISGFTGIECIQLIIEQSYVFLKRPGWLFIEHCNKQVYQVQSLFLKNKFVKVQSIYDYSGKYRITFGLLT